MKLINRLLDYRKPWKLPHMALFTGNPIIKRNGAIVMGRGAARMVRDHFPGIDLRFGEMIAANPGKPILWHKVGDQQFIGWLQVKYHWQEPAEPGLIRLSCILLGELAKSYPERTFHMNYPGIGNGKLEEHQVRSIVEDLPDNVWLYRS